MSTTNKKSLASQALLEMDAIKAAIKEESKSTISTMLTEAVKHALRESIDEEDDDEYTVEEEDDEKKNTEKGTGSVKEDGEQEEDPTAAPAAPAAEAAPGAEAAPAAPAAPAADAEGMAAGEGEAAVEGGEGGDWSQFDKYKVGDDTYDLTGEEDYEQVVKVYKLLNSDDQVVVKKNNGKIELKDNEAGTEYVIDLGGEDEGAEPEAEAPSVDGGEEAEAPLNEGIFEFEFGDEDGLDEEGEFGMDEEFDDPDGIAGQPAGMNENKRNRKKTMKESKEVLFEVDLGYTDNYQDKDPIKGLSNNEPSKSGKSWHKGVPTGTEKPWAGKTAGKGDPFDKAVNEEFEELDDTQLMEDEPMGAEMGGEMEAPMEEATNVGGAVQQRTSSKSHIPANRKEHGPKVKRHVSTEANYQETVNESKENKELKKAVKELRTALQEAYLVNVNLGKITKLFLENTTTQAEKIEIINRFNNEAKTIDQSKALFESINNQLKKGPKAEQVMENRANSAAPLNENKNYGRSKELLGIINLMDRMKNC